MQLRSGHFVVLGLAASMALGWVFYRSFVPAAWLHDFAADIALRTAPDPDAPPPRDTREATPRGLADHPYICLAHLAPFRWDRLVVVPSRADLREQPRLKTVAWTDDEPNKYWRRMKADPRYQLIVLLDGERVVANELFYTFWGDLSALARPDGFAREEAVFTAIISAGTHVLTPVAPPYPAVCGG